MSKILKILLLPIIIMLWMFGWILIVIGEWSDNQKKEAKT